MKAKCLATKIRFLLTAFSLALFLVAGGCSSHYGGGGGGGTSPAITGLSVTSGAVGTSVTISGNYFGASQGSSTVTFNGTAATATSWSNTSIAVTVPSGATTGYVVVTVGGVASNSVTFTVTGSGGGSSAGWTFIQDNALFFCQGANITGCSGGSFLGNMTPTVTGSVWVLEVQGPNNFTITSVTGGGGQWVHCPNCHATNSNGFNVDAWYNLSGNAGEDGSHLAFTLSGSAGSFISVNFEEVLPPPGTIAYYDTSGISTPTNCSGTSATPCTGVSLTLSATDVVISNPGGAPNASWNSWSAPYITTSNGSGIALNVSGATAPTSAYLPCGSSHNTTCNPEFMAIAFKSSAGTFTPPTPQYSIVQIVTAQGPAAQSGGGMTCNPGCNVALSKPTTSGDLLFIEGNSGQGGFISAITCAPSACTSGSSAAVIPTGNSASVCQRSYNGVPGISNAAFSCGYILNVPGGITSLNVTATTASAFTVTGIEVALPPGKTSFLLDAQASTQIPGTNRNPTGQSLTLTGSNDVIFQTLWVNGGGNTPNYYAQPNLGWYCTGTGSSTACNSVNYTMFNQAEIAILLDSGPTAPPMVWVNPQNTADLVTGVAFKTQ